MRWQQAQHQPGGSVTALPRIRCFLHLQNARCRNQRLPEHTADAHAPLPGGFRSHLGKHPSACRPGRSDKSVLLLRCCLPLQCRFQHRRQLFATHGSPPQNTETRLRTQIVPLGHSGLQNLRQGRYVFFFGERPTIVHQELDTRRSIRLPRSSQRRAILSSQAQAPRRSVL